MAVPKYHEFMKPILEEIKDGDEFSMSDMKSRMAERFKLSEEECKELLPSGTEAVFSNRVGWARTYLKKAGLLTIPKPSWIKITERGQEVLKEDIEEITASYLRKFPEFVEFQTPSNNKKNEKNINEHEDETPVETLETAFRQIKKGLKKELIDHIMDCNPFFFEKTVIDLLLNLGYGGSRKEAGEAFMTSGDGGIDGVIKEDKLGLDLIYIQAKRWKEDSCVGRPEIQKFAGALQGKRAKKGIFITTSYFSSEAKEFAKGIESKIILIDGDSLTDYMIDSNTGVSLERRFEIKKIDSDYFSED